MHNEPLAVSHIFDHIPNSSTGLYDNLQLAVMKQQLARNYSVEIVAVDDGESPPLDVVYKTFAPGWALFSPNTAGVAHNAVHNKAMYKYLKSRRDIDLIHSHTLSRPAASAWSAAQKTKKPFLLTVNEPFYTAPEKTNRFDQPENQPRFSREFYLDTRLGYYRLVNEADGIICTDLNEYEEMRERHLVKPILHLHPPVNTIMFDKGDARRFRKAYDIPENRTIILSTGPISETMNQKQLLTLLAWAQADKLETHLVLIGEIISTAYFTQLIHSIEHSAAWGRTTVIPQAAHECEDLADAYAAASLCVSASHSDPDATPILDAWAAKKPIVTTDIPEYRELIEHGVNGLLYDGKDMSILYDIYRTTLRSPETVLPRIEKGFAEVKKNHSWSDYMDKLDQFYWEIVDRHRRSL